jgi:hypothetical protein
VVLYETKATGQTQDVSNALIADVLLTSKKVFLKSISPSILYTDLTENTEKSGFFKGLSVKLRGVRVQKSL